ncbi:MAG: alpha/beta hydrolase [Armatimonadota bacterium]|nr:alpha/beta hydrolase [Armatimonadota bacterium]MDR7485092.1 alpha/beta hydrolase [Armatimonadota bacterium]MDR7533480.1 alpha/beta hydrolase [Armatimonadota bacterium]MDR7537019.1 alpha/beta hydrolase [Armatimonadota bacterium]
MPADVTGVGEPVVLVPGGLTGWVSWIPHAEQLARTHRVVRVQLLSVEFGLRGAPLPDGYGVSTESAALAGTLDRLGIARADFAGWSYGAEVLLDFALDHPGRVRSLVLIEPPAFWVLRARGRLEGALGTGARAFQQVLRRFGPGDVSEEQLAQFLCLAGIVPPDADPRAAPQWPLWTQHRQSLRTGDAAFRHDDDLARVRVFPHPVLLFKGLGSPDYLRAIVDVLGDEFPYAVVHELPGAHVLHLVAMQEFLGLFAASLASRG